MLKILDSQTALFVTFIRAIAYQSPKNNILKDPYAEKFLPWLMRRPLKRKLFVKLTEKILRRNKIGNNILIRARYAENQLENCIKQGVKQYIILGAGWDSFAFRKQDLLKDLNVFELDFPSTQEKKRKKLKQLGLTLPKNVHLTPIDFETTSISEALSKSTFDPNLPTFVTWQGVTYYLSIDAIEHVFDDLGNYCKGKLDIVLDYIDDRYFENWKKNRHTRRLHYAVSLVGEPFKSGFNPKTFSSWLSDRGYDLSEDLNIKTQIEYFGQENLDAFQPSRGIHLAHIKKQASHHPNTLEKSI